jgi:hypothetical protein
MGANFVLRSWTNTMAGSALLKYFLSGIRVLRRSNRRNRDHHTSCDNPSEHLDFLPYYWFGDPFRAGG